MSLSLRECIVIIVDIDRDFSYGKSEHIYLIDELARILHTIHREVDLIDDLSPKHPISIVCVSEVST
jgi:hypothetical protein